MKQVFTLILMLLASRGFCQSENILPFGKYMFSAPAMFKRSDGSISEHLCEMKVLDNGIRRLSFIDTVTVSFIDFSISDSGEIKIVQSSTGMGEIGRKIRGTGKLLDNKTASGKMTAISGAMGFLLVQRDRSEWHMRPATEQEITEKMIKGLKRVADALYSKKKPSLDQIEKELPTGVGSGYSYSDRAKIMEMLQEGTLSFTNNQFILKKKVAAEVPQIPPISPEVETEKIPYKSKEELLKIVKSFEEEEAPPSPRESVPVAKVEKKAKPVPVVKQEDPPKTRVEKKLLLSEQPVPVEKATNYFTVVLAIAVVGCVVLFGGMVRMIRKRHQG